MSLQKEESARPSPLIGNNELRLNGATMMAAVQMYLDAAFAPDKAPKVTSIRSETNSSAVSYVVTVLGSEPR